MKKRHTEEQIVKILHEAEAGRPIQELCQEHNITEQTFYRWRNKYGGLEVCEAKRLKALEQENDALKKIVADLTLDNRMLKDVNAKKW